MRQNLRWATANAVGMVVYLVLGSRMWALPGEEGLLGGPGDGFYFLMCMAPILIAFLIYNLAKIAGFIYRFRQERPVGAVVVWFLLSVTWIAVLVFDFRHH